jgi:hypothetical protein
MPPSNANNLAFPLPFRSSRRSPGASGWHKRRRRSGGARRGRNASG